MVWCGGVGDIMKVGGLWNILGTYFMLGKVLYIKECKSRHSWIG